MGSLSHWVHRYFVDNGASSWWLTGLRNTLLITVLALCIGVVLGFTVAIIRSTYEQTGKLKVLNAICKVYLSVIRGTPTMVQVLIFNFVIFASIAVNEVIVGGVAFGINSGAYVRRSCGRVSCPSIKDRWRPDGVWDLVPDRR